jgi:hypothetical protein
MNAEKAVKIVGLLIITVLVPIAASVILLNVFPDVFHILLLVAVALAAIHPALGINPLSNTLELVKPPQIIKKIKEETKDAPPAPIYTKPDNYIDQLPELRQKMIECCDLEKQPADNDPNSLWRVLLTQKRDDFIVSVHKREGTDFFFRVVVDFEATPEEMFDLIADVERRPDWDELTVKAGIVERISDKTAIQVFYDLFSICNQKDFGQQLLEML